MSFTSTGQVEYSGTGTITALNGAVTVPIPTFSMLLFTLSGTWSATVSFEASVDGSTYFSVPACLVPNAASVSSATSNATYGIAVGGYNSFRVRASVFSSGTVAVSWNADSNTNPTFSPHTLNGATDGTTIGNITDRLKTSTTYSNLISTNNSSTANLAAAGVFTGTGDDASGYGNITVTVFSSHTGSFTVQWSDDNATWRADGDTYAITATTLKTVEYGPALRYFRVVYTNGGTLTTTLVIQTVLRVGYTKPSSHRFGSSMSDDTDGEAVKAVLVGFSPAGPYVNAKFSNVNEQQVSDICDNGGTHAALTVGTSAVIANVSGTNKTNRKSLTIYNNGTVLIYWGHTNAVTTSTGTPIVPGTIAIFVIGSNTDVYLISGTVSQNTRITEMS